MDRLIEQVTQLTQSRLVRTLAVGFIFIVLADLTCLGLLSVETVRIENHATHEAQMIRAMQNLSAMTKVLVYQRLFVDKNRDRLDTGREDNQVYVRRIKDKMKAAMREWKGAGLPTGEIEALSKIAATICADSTAVFAEGASKAVRDEAYNAYANHHLNLYAELGRRLDSIHDTVLSQEAPHSEIDPMILCMVAVGINLVACILAGGVTRPISRLSNNCKNLMAGKVIPVPTSDQPEIRVLETTFHEMSGIIAEAENSRVSFLKEMQNAQEVTLQHVQGYVEDLANARSTQTEESADVFKLMKTNIDGMLFLLSSMTYGLNFNPEEDLVVTPMSTSTTELLDNGKNTVTWLMKRKRIELIVEDPAVELECDVRLIGRVILNLLSNAAKFSDNRSKIRLSARLLDDGVRFSVRDYGCGISVANQEKLFKKFSQVEAVDGVQRAGSGLGLLICKNIVNAHGGEIICESIENEGTCFWFKLPFKCMPSQKAAEASKAVSRSLFAEKFTRNLLLLIVAYVVSQMIFVFRLASEFQHAKYLSSEYSQQKELTLDTQEILTTFISWRQTGFRAVQSNDFQSFMDLHPLMQKQQELVSRMISVCKSNSPELIRLRIVETNLIRLGKIADNCVDGVSAQQMLDSKNTFDQVVKLGSSVEKNLFKMFMDQNDGLNVTYDLSKTLRQDISNTFLLATMVNAGVLIALCWTGLSIVSKVAELNNKALKFAAGGDLTRSISGKDELAYLDERLCDVAQKVRAAQRQRQDMMAIINHDLRTPLGAFLNGLEMLSSGMIGEVSEEDARLIEQAEHDVRSVLRIIDEFLDTEKAAFEAQ